MSLIQTPAIVRRPDVTGDRTYWFLHNLATVLVRGAETVDGLGLVEMLGARGDMPPLHVHHEEDEVFLVLEGSLSLWVGDKAATIGAGETALAPRGVPHVYRVESEQARWLAVVTPSRFTASSRRSACPLGRSSSRPGPCPYPILRTSSSARRPSGSRSSVLPAPCPASAGVTPTSHGVRTHPGLWAARRGSGVRRR